MTARILIVDDVLANAGLLEAVLVGEYYEVAVAQDGPAALNLALVWQPDVILLDVVMPGMDGFVTCRRLKSEARTRNIPVVMITSLAAAGERLRGLEAGADDFLTKPVGHDMLLARVRSVVRLKRLLDELRARGETARALGISEALAGEMSSIAFVTGSRALIIDDVDQDARAVQEDLSREGILPSVVSTEAETLALTAVLPFDLIVLSLSLATDDPLRLVSRLRATDATHDTPMLLLAAPQRRHQLLRGLDLGANDWLDRPVDGNELRARARNQIRRKLYQDRLRADLGLALEMALVDPLTGFFNQRYLMRHLGSLLEAGQPSGLAVLMLDVDNFKAVNDRWGHAVGDRALKAVADMMRSRVRAVDSIARYGGEEFVVLMPGTEPQEALQMAEHLRSGVEGITFAPAPGLTHALTISIGAAFAVGIEISAANVLRAADAAMYRAKRGGRNRVDSAASMSEATAKAPTLSWLP